MNEGRNQFGADSPKIPDKYTFESLARKKQTVKPDHSEFESYLCNFLATLWIKLLNFHFIVIKCDEITSWEQI